MEGRGGGGEGGEKIKEVRKVVWWEGSPDFSTPALGIWDIAYGLCHSKCVPRTSSILVTGEPVRHAESQGPPQT